MRSEEDSPGKRVISKPLQARLGLAAGPEVEIREQDGKTGNEGAPTPMKLVNRRGGLVAVPRGPLPPLSDDIVRATLERTRR